MKADQPVLFKSVALHRVVGQPAPLHPLVSLVNYGEVSGDHAAVAYQTPLEFRQTFKD